MKKLFTSLFLFLVCFSGFAQWQNNAGRRPNNGQNNNYAQNSALIVSASSQSFCTWARVASGFNKV